MKKILKSIAWLVLIGLAFALLLLVTGGDNAGDREFPTVIPPGVRGKEAAP